jgi:hypothetical protein
LLTIKPGCKLYEYPNYQYSPEYRGSGLAEIIYTLWRGDKCGVGKGQMEQPVNGQGSDKYAFGKTSSDSYLNTSWHCIGRKDNSCGAVSFNRGKVNFIASIK